MWSKKEESEKKDEHEVCVGCGAYIDKINPVEISIPSRYDFGIIYYCNKCKKPYNKIIEVFADMRARQGTKHYFAEVEVNEKGEPLKK